MELFEKSVRLDFLCHLSFRLRWYVVGDRVEKCVISPCFKYDTEICTFLLCWVMECVNQKFNNLLRLKDHLIHLQQIALSSAFPGNSTLHRPLTPWLITFINVVFSLLSLSHCLSSIPSIRRQHNWGERTVFNFYDPVVVLDLLLLVL